MTPLTIPVLAIASLALSACAYRDINPEQGAADELAASGYEELSEVEPGTAKLVLRASGSGHPVRFSASTSPQTCQGFKPLGNVAYKGQGVVYPWIARMANRTSGTSPYLVHNATPGEPMQVRADGRWSKSAGGAGGYGACGPLVASFTPQNEHAYTVEFAWSGLTPNSCRLIIMDVTQPDAPQPAETQTINDCPSPLSN